MTQISAEQANSEFGISTAHNRYPSGEVRFRLKKNDGTAYIRTEATSSGAWQESHFHSTVRETYIVQTGWIAFAQWLESKLVLSLHTAGDIFTTQPGVVHNIYMAPNSVIHTVKHGSGKGEDRNTSGAAELDALCKSLSSPQLVMAAAADFSKTVESAYSGDYKHFDTLIWQSPMWNSAVFALSLAAIGSEGIDTFAARLSLDINSVTFVILLTLSMTLFGFSWVTFRFRRHQQPLKLYKATPIWKSASSISQFISNLQATLLFGLALATLDLPLPATWISSAIILSVTTVLMEKGIRNPSHPSAS